MTNSTPDTRLARILSIFASQTGHQADNQTADEVARILAEPAVSESSVAGEFLSQDVTILLADLRGFTSVSEQYPIEVVLKILNDYFADMSRIIFEHGGTIDKFMGDSIMVVFGAPTPHPDDPLRAVRCATQMQIAIERTNQLHKERNLPELAMGIGINTGTVMAGKLGSALYSEYTVIGDEVNLASRIETFSLRGQILISQSTYARCKDLVKTAAPELVHVKGKQHPVVLLEVTGIPSMDIEVPRIEIRRSPRVEVAINFAFHIVMEDKSVDNELHHGVLRDLGYHGALAEMDVELPVRSDIKMDVDLTLIGYEAHDIYAKVLKVNRVDERFQASIEFTSASIQTDINIQQFIQLLMQGAKRR